VRIFTMLLPELASCDEQVARRSPTVAHPPPGCPHRDRAGAAHRDDREQPFLERDAGDVCERHR
jgi:hypothetical protein